MFLFFIAANVIGHMRRWRMGKTIYIYKHIYRMFQFQQDSVSGDFNFRKIQFQDGFRAFIATIVIGHMRRWRMGNIAPLKPFKHHSSIELGG